MAALWPMANAWEHAFFRCLTAFKRRIMPTSAKMRFQGSICFIIPLLTIIISLSIISIIHCSEISLFLGFTIICALILFLDP